MTRLSQTQPTRHAASDVEGVFAVGASRAQVEERMADALAAHLAFLRESGEPIPEPHTEAGHVAA